MVEKVKVGGKNISAIIVECEKDQVHLYRNALIDTLKVASLNSQCDLKGSTVSTVLDVIQATLPEEEGGES